MYFQFQNSPVGWLKIEASSEFLTAIHYCDAASDSHPNPITQETATQLDAYFNKKRSVFDLPLQPSGTVFQEKVWKELLKIPFGKTISYLELSKRLEDAKAIRAVGRANGKNPIPIIIPCHRVIGSDGSLTGYAGGLQIKKHLLELEGILIQQELDFNS